MCLHVFFIKLGLFFIMLVAWFAGWVFVWFGQQRAEQKQNCHHRYYCWLTVCLVWTAKGTAIAELSSLKLLFTAKPCDAVKFTSFIAVCSGLTMTLCGPSSNAIAWVRESMAPFEAQKAVHQDTRDSLAAVLEMLTMAPPLPCSTMRPATTCEAEIT